MTRILSLPASQLAALDRAALTTAIAESEGRVVVAETIAVAQPLLEGVTNAELVAAMGADLLLLNMFDITEPVIHGLPEHDGPTLAYLCHLTGRPIGINLEPTGVPTGRLATAANAVAAVDNGAQFIVVTANPGTGAANDSIRRAIVEVSAAVDDRAMVIGGRMHAAGVVGESGAKIVAPSDVRSFADAGADVVLLPAPGTVPGLTTEHVHALVDAAHSTGSLAMTAIGTSQEGADAATIRAIALAAKQAGADLHHLGDGGYSGIAVPDNVMTYSIVIRGVRHTWRRMAASPNR